jgi:hypothetical protein
MAPETQMNSTTNSNPGATRGASELSPGDKMNDARTVGSGSTSRGSTKGASELSPGDKMNDKRGHRERRGPFYICVIVCSLAGWSFDPDSIAQKN